MAKPKQKKTTGVGVILTNRKAPRDYHIEETFEAGVALCGTEVKSLRAGRGNLSDAFVRIDNGEAWLYNCDIQPYEQGNRHNHDAKASRRLLLHRNEIRRLHGSMSAKGRALVALKMYWKKRNIKVLLGLGTGKNVRDKREDIKKRVQNREMQQAMKDARRR